MKRETRNVWLLVAGVMVVLMAGSGVRGLEVSAAEPRSHYYQDVNFLGDDAVRGDIENMLADFQERVGRQIVVVVYGRKNSDLPAQQYGEAVAAAWRDEGTYVKKDGVVIFIFAEDREAAIVPAEGLEKVLTPEDCAEIIAHDGMPGIRSGEHEGAVKNMLESVMLGVQGIYVRPSTVVVPRRTWWDVMKQVGAWVCLLCIPAFFIFAWLLPTPKGVTYSSGGSSGWFVAFAVAGALAGMGSGGGGGGGYSSSGGGTFGGGGAGGKW